MLKVYRLMMESCKFFVILLLYCVTAAYCYPTKPLNERSSSVTWQAWLLVNDDNQNKQQTNADGMLRRRITPKSVFFAPTFDPESLPPCSEGYSSDMKGACVPIIKIDEDSHYEFLIQKLKDKLGPVDYDYDDESSQGPLQLNIPLDEEKDDGETGGAIVISPTKTFGTNVDKRDSTEDEKKQEEFLKKLAATTANKSEETTTSVGPTTDLTSEKASTLTDDLTVATEALTTTEDFTTPTESHNTKRSLGDPELTTTEEDAETTTIFDLTTTPSEDLSTSPPKVRVAVSEPQAHNSFKFPEETVTQKSIKFPDADVSYRTQIPSSVELNRDVINDAPFSQSVKTLVSDGKVVFRDESQPEEANLDYSNGVRHLPATTTPPSFNRRNRDKFLLPPGWSQPNFQKPLVLRFSRKHSYLDVGRFKRPDFYRAVPMDDYTYLFSKHRLSGHR